MTPRDARHGRVTRRGIALGGAALALASGTAYAEGGTQFAVAVPTDGISLDPHKSATVADEDAGPLGR